MTIPPETIDALIIRLTEYERRKALLREQDHLTPKQYEAAIDALCEELGM